AAGNRDRGVAVVEAAREVAAGRGRPAERGQLADVDDDLAGEFAQAVVVVGQGIAHVPEFTAVPSLGGRLADAPWERPWPRLPSAPGIAAMAAPTAADQAGRADVRRPKSRYRAQASTTMPAAPSIICTDEDANSSAHATSAPIPS